VFTPRAVLRYSGLCATEPRGYTTAVAPAARAAARDHRLSRRFAILLRPVQSILISAASVRLESVSMPAVISAHQLPNEAIPTTKNPIHFIIPFECRPFAWPFLQSGHRWRSRAYSTMAH
jgi:hypothetical protein